MLSSTKHPQIPNRESAHGAALPACRCTCSGLLGDSYGSRAKFMQPETPMHATRAMQTSLRAQDAETIGRFLRVSSAPVLLATH